MNESALNYDEVARQVAPLFRCGDERLERFIVEVYRQCVLGKVFPAEAPLAHNWISPGGCYRGQWIWDTMFVVDLLSRLPGQRDVIRGVFQNYWDFQQRWDAVKPAFAHGMIACMIRPGDDNPPAYSQIPILAWGLERVFQQTGDEELVRQALEPLEHFHDWYWRERDVTGVHLIGVGAYSGHVQDARYETFDFEPNLDDLQLTAAPGRGPWYGSILVPGLTAYLILAEQCLERLARQAGATALAERRRRRHEAGSAMMRAHMWDEAAGTFLAVERDTLRKLPVATIGSWIPLLAGVPTAVMAKRMAAVLASPDWATPLPVPTVSWHNPHWNDGKFNNPGGNFWRGDVWPPTNYQIATGLARYGHHELATHIADATVKNALAHGINERYHCDTGQPLGVSNLGMSCTILTLLLDGLSRQHRIQRQ